MQIQGECSDLLTISVFPVEGRLLFTKKRGRSRFSGGKEGVLCKIRENHQHVIGRGGENHQT